MQRYTPSYRLNVVEKALHRATHETLVQCATQQGIGYSTLTRWMAQARNDGLRTAGERPQEKRPQDWSAAQKLQALIETAALTEQDQGGYCRQHGIFQQNLIQWKQEFMRTPDSQTTALKAENRMLKEELKQVQRELARKEKALAEAAALLVLKKKAQTFYASDADA